jgi:hypothetical protein
MSDLIKKLPGKKNIYAAPAKSGGATKPAQAPTPASSETTPPAAPPPSSTAQRQQPLYFINGPMDYLLIGGLSVLAYFALYFFHDGQRSSLVVALAAQLMWVCNWPHFSATSYRLYHSRANIMQYPITALVIPWFILLGLAASILSPTIVAPYFVKLYMIWSPYHFSGQTLGITLIYARRAGFQIGYWQRLGLSVFIFGSFLVSTARAETNLHGSEYYGIQYPGLGIPGWVPSLIEMLMYAGGATFLLLTVRQSIRDNRALPFIILLPALTQYVWFVPGGYLASFNEFVPFFHSMQYMLIAWSVQLKEKMDMQHIPPSARYVRNETIRWYGLNVLGGAALFVVFPWVTAALLTQSLGTAQNWSQVLLFTTGLTAVAVQIHHFFVDGVIWKLKRTTVASPLMVNLDEMIHGKPGVATPVAAATAAAATAGASR